MSKVVWAIIINFQQLFFLTKGHRSGVNCFPNQYLYASACFACPANSWSSGGSSSVCLPDVGFYNLGASLTAYYTFNPEEFVVDTSGVSGSLQNINNVAPDYGTLTGWFDGQNVSYFSQESGVADYSVSPQYFALPTVLLQTAFSICVWYQPAAGARNFERVVDLGNGECADSVVISRYIKTSQLNIEFCSASGSTLEFSQQYNNMFVSSYWQHVCLVVDSLQGQLYYNGSIVANFTLPYAHQRKITAGKIARSNWYNSTKAT